MTSWGSGWAREFWTWVSKTSSLELLTYLFPSLFSIYKIPHLGVLKLGSMVQLWTEQIQAQCSNTIISLKKKSLFFSSVLHLKTVHLYMYIIPIKTTYRHIKWKMWDKVVAKQPIWREFWPPKKLLSLISLSTERSRLSPLSHFPLTFHPPQSGFLFSTATTFKLPNPV